MNFVNNYKYGESAELRGHNGKVPVSIGERSKAGTVYDRLNIGIAGSNPNWGMCVCPHVSVLCCPVSVEALRRAEPRSSSPNKCLYM
jgi:hypothetical protein